MDTKSWATSFGITASLSIASALLTFTDVSDPIFAVLAGTSVAAATVAIALIAQRRAQSQGATSLDERVTALLDEARRLSAEQARLQSELDALGELTHQGVREEEATRDRGETAEAS